MKLLVLLAAFFSLSVSADEVSKLVCHSSQGYATIEIKKDCMSVNIEKITREPRHTCPRCSNGGLTEERYLPVHSFSTCNINEFGNDLTVAESNEATGKKITYTATAQRCLRPGCIDYELKLALLDKKGNGDWELNSVNTSKTGTDYYQINEKFELPPILWFMSCSKVN